jgi:hypothetical protein
MKAIKHFQINTLQEYETTSTMVIDVLKSDNFPYKLSLSFNVDGKKHYITNQQLRMLIEEFENNEKLNKEIYEKNI